MRTYQQLMEKGIDSLKRRLIKQRGPICVACGGKRRNGNLIICVIDPRKEPCDSNLVLMDDDCQRNLMMIIEMFYGRGEKDMEQVYDYRAGDGKLAVVNQHQEQPK